MTKEKMTQLIEALASVGYTITNIDTLRNISQINKYGDIEILLVPISKVKNLFLKERIIKLAEVLYSLEYGIVTYDLLCKHTYGDTRLVLQSL
jgi:hypothetical protein